MRSSRRALRHALSWLAARGGRLHGQDDAQPNWAGLTSDATLVLSEGIGLLVRHEATRQLGAWPRHSYADQAQLRIWPC